MVLASFHSLWMLHNQLGWKLQTIKITVGYPLTEYTHRSTGLTFFSENPGEYVNIFVAEKKMYTRHRKNQNNCWRLYQPNLPNLFQAGNYYTMTEEDNIHFYLYIQKLIKLANKILQQNRTNKKTQQNLEFNI